MDVRRPERVAALRPQQAADHAVGRDRVAGGLDRAEPEAAVRVGRELAAQVHLGLLRVLVLVEADRRGVPDVDLGARRSGRPVAVEDARIHEERPGLASASARGSRRSRPAASPVRQNGPSSDCEVSVWPWSPLLSRQTSEEIPSEPAISTISLWRSLVRWPISLRIAVGVAELVLGEAHLAHEGMQMADERDHDLAQARIGVRAMTASTAWVTSSWPWTIIHAALGEAQRRSRRARRM